jgi:hypothetical protein
MGASVAVLDIAGAPVELHIRRSKRVRGHRIVVRYGLPPELVVRPRATREEIAEAIDSSRRRGCRSSASIACG